MVVAEIASEAVEGAAIVGASDPAGLAVLKVATETAVKAGTLPAEAEGDGAGNMGMAAGAAEGVNVVAAEGEIIKLVSCPDSDSASSSNKTIVNKKNNEH